MLGISIYLLPPHDELLCWWHFHTADSNKAPILGAGGFCGQKEEHPNHPVPTKSKPKSQLTIKYIKQERHFNLLATMWPPSAPYHRKNALHFYSENRGISGVYFYIFNPWGLYFLGKKNCIPFTERWGRMKEAGLSWGPPSWWRYIQRTLKEEKNHDQAK